MLSQPGDNDFCCVGASETVVEKIVALAFSGRSKPEPDAPAPLTIEITSSRSAIIDTY